MRKLSRDGPLSKLLVSIMFLPPGAEEKTLATLENLEIVDAPSVRSGFNF